jgi:hypothetical protein
MVLTVVVVAMVMVVAMLLGIIVMIMPFLHILRIASSASSERTCHQGERSALAEKLGA